MTFTEYHHGFISGSFYKKLKDGYGEKGLAVFTLATQRYGEQRGSRMAQKAIKLGLPLDYESYFKLGEWVNSEQFLSSLKGPQAENLSYTPDYCREVFACPWHEQYKNMGLLDGGSLYCRDIDKSIVRGFNPYLVFHVHETLHESDKCIQDYKDAKLENRPDRLKEYIKPMEYHCAHVFFTFSEITKSILGDEGGKISEAVLADFSRDYGKEMTEKLLSYKDMNFNIIN